jgi:hypothetical protein
VHLILCLWLRWERCMLCGVYHFDVVYTSKLKPSALCALLIVTFIKLSLFLLTTSSLLFPLLSLFPFFRCLPSSFPKLSSPLYLLSSLPRTEPMFRFKFADAGNMSPPLISFSEVAFSYSGANTHRHTRTLQT